MRSWIVICVVLSSFVVANAQQIAVQQPVVSTNSVRTTVSVPDRGSALLGGVGSAQSGRSSYGPLRSGSSRSGLRPTCLTQVPTWMRLTRSSEAEMCGLFSKMAKPSTDQAFIARELAVKISRQVRCGECEPTTAIET